MNSNIAKILIAGSLGILVHVLFKVKAINDDLKTENYRSVFSAYWRMDWVIVLISFLGIIVAAYTSDEWLPMKLESQIAPNTLSGILLAKLSAVVKLLAFTLGLVIDYALALFMSVTKGKLMKKAISEGATMDDIAKITKSSLTVKSIVPDNSSNQNQ